MKIAIFQHYLCFSMNYLAHSFLSFSIEPVLLGQFIADDVKGNKWQLLPEEVQRGVLLHRFIDDFTDRHPLMLDLKKLLHPTLGKFSGVVLDILLDHVLSLKWHEYSQTDRQCWIDSTYRQLSGYMNEMTEKRQIIISKMIEHDWMNMYKTPEGTSRILLNMSRRIPFSNPLKDSFEVYLKHEASIQSVFDDFFPQILSATQHKLNIFAP